MSDEPTAAQRVAAALRDVADMVEALDIPDVEVSARIDFRGEVRVGIEPMGGRGELHDPAGARRAMDAIAEYIGAELHASFSRGDLWGLYTDRESGLLPGGANAYAHRRVPGRPLDLAPLPERRRRTGGAA